jgi:collagenase-like PrtC family protease
MPNLEFEVPYNNDLETLEEVLKMKELNGNRIREVYMASPKEYSGSGRVLPEVNTEQIIKVVDRVHREGVRANLLLNSTCQGEFGYEPEVLEPKLAFLEEMHKEHGVEAVSIADPLYIKAVRERLPDIEICSSVLADIDNLQKAVIHRRVGSDVIIPDVNINRDLKLLRKIKEVTGVTLKLMANEGCIHHCAWRKFQFNYIAHQPKDILINGDHLFFECQRMIAEDPSQILKSCWIRPEDTKRYEGITNHFKIVGRDKPRSHVIRTVRAYMEESWSGDLLDILCASLNTFTMTHGVYLDNKKLDNFGFFEKVTTCDQNCDACNYCSQLASQLVKFGMMTRQKLEDFGMKDVADRLDQRAREGTRNRRL